jgi:DNA-binding MarR family transcriptional regulator/GNAT superfamily N-acetyltransferase
MDKTTELRAVKIREFNRFYTNIVGLVNQTILESPYSLAEVRVLLEIDSAGQCTASDLTKLLEIDPGYLSRILKRFKKEQLVITSKSLTDGRAQVLSLTDKGRETFIKLSLTSTDQIAKLLAHMPNSDQHKLVSYMGAIQTILSGQKDTSITIRSQKPGDVGYIAYRHGVLYAQEYGLDQVFERYVLTSLTKFLENQSAGNIWIAEFGGNIIGFIGIVGIDQETAQLRWFLIEPEFRGTGLGRRLMTVAIDYCKEKQFKRVFLWTFQGLDAARHLYEKFGFTPSELVENNTWKHQVIEERWNLTLPD